MTPMFQMIVYLKERGMQDSQRYLKFLILLVSSIETATEIRIALLWRNHYLKINFHDTKVWIFHLFLIRHSKQWTDVNRKWQSKNSVWFVWLRTNIVIHTFWKSRFRPMRVLSLNGAKNQISQLLIGCLISTINSLIGCILILTKN